MGNASKSEIRYLAAVGIGVTVTAIQLFQASDPYGLKVLLLLAGVCLLPRTIKWSSIDVAATLLWAYDLLLCFTSVNPMPTLWAARISTQYFLTYLLFRQVVNHPQGALWLRRGMWVVMYAGIGLALLSFGIFRRSILEAGFTDLYPFRFLFRPLGYSTNAWTTVLLCTAGMTLSLRPSKGIGRWAGSGLLLLSLTGLLLSFSRGTFLAFGLLLLLLLLVLSPLKEKIRMLLLACLAAGVVSVSSGSEVLTALRMNRTVSQQQSTQGRLNATQASLEVFRDHPWLGVGAANYTLAIDRELNQDTTQARTSYPPNWVVEVLVEKGLTGLVLYVGLLGCIGWMLWQGRKRQICRVAGCTLLVVALKEMTLSTLLSTSVGMTLACLLLACLQQEEEMKTEGAVSPWKLRMARGVLAVCLASYVGTEGGGLWLSAQATRCKEAKACMDRGDYAGAAHRLESMWQSVPVLVNRGMLDLERHREERNPQYAEEAEAAFAEACRKQPEDISIGYLLATARFAKGEKEGAIADLKELAHQYPRNALYLYTLSQWLYEDGEKEEASGCLETAIRLVPRLLLSDRIRQWEESDSCFWRQMEDRLMSRYPSGTDLPSDFARYGFIAYRYGNINKATECLEHAVSIMPSLSTPWFLLGQIHREQGREEEAESCFRKYRLLAYGAFASGTMPSDSLRSPVFHEDDLLKDYAVKFKEWYQYELFLTLH